MHKATEIALGRFFLSSFYRIMKKKKTIEKKVGK